MDFQYSAAPQRSPEWFRLRRGKVTASRLEDWLSVSRAKGKEGEPLKARTDYEKELSFERQFDVNYNNYVTEAMLDGIELEQFAREQYQRITGNKVDEVGCFYSDKFVASPDGIVSNVKTGEKGLLEIKVLRDASFMEVLSNGVLPAHYKQIQGCLLASGLDWCDYVTLNLTTKKIDIIEIKKDADMQQQILESLVTGFTEVIFDEATLHDVSAELSGVKIGNTPTDTAKGGTDLW